MTNARIQQNCSCCCSASPRKNQKQLLLCRSMTSNCVNTQARYGAGYVRLVNLRQNTTLLLGEALQPANRWLGHISSSYVWVVFLTTVFRPSYCGVALRWFLALDRTHQWYSFQFLAHIVSCSSSTSDKQNIAWVTLLHHQLATCYHDLIFNTTDLIKNTVQKNKYTFLWQASNSQVLLCNAKIK